MIDKLTHDRLTGRLFLRSILVPFACVLLIVFFYQSLLQAEEKKTKEKTPDTTVMPNNIVPDHEVRYEDDLSPEWKANWDSARQLCRDGKIRESLVQYELLLSMKENIDVARWEYAALLIRQQRWQEAEEQLEKLITNDPRNSNYLLTIAEVYVNTGKINSAIKLYKNLYVETSEQKKSVFVLEGLIKALEAKGKPRELLFYLKKLIALQPKNKGLKIRVARLGIESGNLEKAKTILEELEQGQPENIEILKLQARLHEKDGDRDAEAAYHEKIISINPDDLESHARLYSYYRSLKKWDMSLKHLEVLLRGSPSAPALLKEAATLNVKLERLDKALDYYDYLLAMNPTNETILQSKKVVQRALARDLVVLVENNGSRKLWQDLVQVTSDRSGVYREIAQILREKNNTGGLVEVLSLICREDPHDDEIVRELTALMKLQGRDDELNTLLQQLHAQKKDTGVDIAQ